MYVIICSVVISLFLYCLIYVVLYEFLPLCIPFFLSPVRYLFIS